MDHIGPKVMCYPDTYSRDGPACLCGSMYGVGGVSGNGKLRDGHHSNPGVQIRISRVDPAFAKMRQRNQDVLDEALCVAKSADRHSRITRVLSNTY